MSFIFLRNRVTGGAAFTPASLFASGEEGAWYEPSPTTCFTDTGGTVAATYGDAVAYLQDSSGNGNHATQATSSARPILARVPEGGRRNELSETDTLATQSVTVTAAERTLSFTGTGTVTLTGASTAGPLVGTGAGDRVSLTFTPSAGSLTLTVLGTVTDAQLELGASATTYQSVADSLGYDITEAGVTSLDYLAFDGSDDVLLTGDVFDPEIATATGKWDAYAAASYDADSVLLAKNGDGAQSENQRQYVVFRRNSGAFWQVAIYGLTITAFTVVSGASVNTGTTYVFRSVFDHELAASGTTANNTARHKLWTNGAADSLSVESSLGNLGTIENGAAQLAIGGQYGTSGPLSGTFSGKLFGLIMLAGVVETDAVADQVEAYLAAKSGVTL